MPGLIPSQPYINAAAIDWWASTSFGNRRFVDILPAFLIGAVFALKRLPHPALSALLVWNFLFIVQYRFGYIPRSDTITARRLLIDKFYIHQVERRY